MYTQGTVYVQKACPVCTTGMRVSLILTNVGFEALAVTNDAFNHF